MAGLYTDLDNLTNDAKDWKCQLLFNQAAFNQGDEDAVDVDIVDLCEFLPYISLRGRKENKDYPPGTNYMFLHWQGKGEDESDGKGFQMHQFVKKRPTLAVTIESLGNVISRKILLMCTMLVVGL